MAKGHTIEIVITEEGKILGEVEDVLGPDCEGLLDFLKELGDVEEQQRTQAYYRRQAQRSTPRLKAGK